MRCPKVTVQRRRLNAHPFHRLVFHFVGDHVKHQIIGVGHYNGDPFVHPDPAVVLAAVNDYRAEAPVAYGIDFGVTADGRTLLVEVNDA